MRDAAAAVSLFMLAAAAPGRAEDSRDSPPKLDGKALIREALKDDPKQDAAMLEQLGYGPGTSDAAEPEANAPARWTAIVLAGELIGGTTAGQWADRYAIRKWLRPGMKGRAYSSGGFLGEQTVARIEDPKGVDDNVSVNLLPSFQETFSIVGDLNPFPRTGQERRDHLDAYRPMIVDELKRHGFRKPEPKLTSAITVDINGDGTLETLVSASDVLRIDNCEEARRREKDFYSLVEMTTRVQGKEVRKPVLESFHSPNHRFDLYYTADFNGDGKMDFVGNDLVNDLDVVEAEGFGYSVKAIYSFEGGRLNEVLFLTHTPR